MQSSWKSILACLLFISPAPSQAFFCKATIKKKVAVAKIVPFVGAATVLGGGAALASILVQQQQGQQQQNLYSPGPESLKGQTFLITGGTTGLGLETAKRLSLGGPQQIIITARTAAKGDIALADIRTYLKDNNRDTEDITLSYKVLDFDDLQGVQQAVASWTDIDNIDCLINNAGVMAIPKREVTVDGFERQIQTNHLGHFVLTALLAPKLSKGARIVNVASAAYMFARPSGLDLDYCWTGEPGYGAWRSYGQSKLANILFSQELQRRADNAGLDWKVSCLHPGTVRTDLGRNLIGIENWEREKDNGDNLLSSTVGKALSAFLKTVEQGASTSVYLAAGANPDAPRARYYVDCEPVTLNSFARDATAAKDLWDESEKKSGVVFSLESLSVPKVVG